jgi:hypothetical protein
MPSDRTAAELIREAMELFRSQHPPAHQPRRALPLDLGKTYARLQAATTCSRNVEMTHG